MRVGVLGAGAWGTAVAALASRRADAVVWARNPEHVEAINRDHRHPTRLGDAALPRGLRATADLAELSGSCDVLIVGVPSAAFRQVLTDAATHVRPWIPVVSLTKGFESGTLQRMTEVAAEILPGHPVAALSGPNLAHEIVAGSAAASVIATADEHIGRALQQLLGNSRFRVYRNLDVIGCEVGGALKNVVAIAAGMAQGLSVGDNTRGAVLTRGLAEMTRVAVALGAEPQTLAGLAGMGDLITTCMSPQSRNRYVGEQRGLGRPLADVLSGMGSVAEGVRTAPFVADLADRLDLDLPVCRDVWREVRGEIPAHEAYRGLAQAAGHEKDPG
jgi:glycerol-3-phosphate dehydrogenase (NAD(P)+)